jgi:hypothetical protein
MGVQCTVHPFSPNAKKYLSIPKKLIQFFIKKIKNSAAVVGQAHWLAPAARPLVAHQRATRGRGLVGRGRLAPNCWSLAGERPEVHKTYETLRKMSFCTKGYAEIHIQRPFLDNKIGIGEILGMKIQTVCTCFDASSTHNFF